MTFLREIPLIKQVIILLILLPPVYSFLPPVYSFTARETKPFVHSKNRGNIGSNGKYYYKKCEKRQKEAGIAQKIHAVFSNMYGILLAGVRGGVV